MKKLLFVLLVISTAATSCRKCWDCKRTYAGRTTEFRACEGDSRYDDVKNYQYIDPNNNTIVWRCTPY